MSIVTFVSIVHLKASRELHLVVHLVVDTAPRQIARTLSHTGRDSTLSDFAARRAQRHRDGIGNAIPAGHFFAEPGTAGVGQAIELGAPIVV